MTVPLELELVPLIVVLIVCVCENQWHILWTLVVSNLNAHTLFSSYNEVDVPQITHAYRKYVIGKNSARVVHTIAQCFNGQRWNLLCHLKFAIVDPLPRSKVVYRYSAWLPCFVWRRWRHSRLFYESAQWRDTDAFVNAPVNQSIDNRHYRPSCVSK